MGVFINDTWQKAAIQNAATGDVVQLNMLIEGETGLQMESIDMETTNSAYQSGFKWTLTLACPDFQGFDTLRQWYLNDDNVWVYAAAAEPNGRNLRWVQNGCKIGKLLQTGKGKRSDGDSYWKLTMTYYGDSSSAIYNSANFFYESYDNWKPGYPNYVGFTDKDNDGVADGYYAWAKGTYSFASGKQTAQLTTALPKPGEGTYNNRCGIQRVIYFPITGIPLTFSADYIVRVSTQGQGGQLRIDAGFIDVAGNEIYHTSKDIVQSGHLSLLLTSSPETNAFYVNLFLTHQPCDLDVWNPCMRIGSGEESKKYIAG